MSEKLDKKPSKVGQVSISLEGKGSAENLSAKIASYEKGKVHASRIIEYLKSLKNPSYDTLIRTLSNCGNYLEFNHYFELDKLILVKASFCKNYKLCELCAIRRSTMLVAKFTDAYLDIQERLPEIKMMSIVLTIKNTSSLLEGYEHLFKGYQNIRQRIRNANRNNGKKSVFSNILGMVGSFEITYNSKTKTWHPHIHLQVLVNQLIDKYLMSQEWLRITGDSMIVYCEQARHPDNPMKDMKEALKYNLKFSTLTPALALKVYQTLKGRNMLITTGLFRGVKNASINREELIGQAFLEIIYHYLNNIGYTLMSTELHSP